MSRKVEWPLIWTLRSQASCMALNVRKRGRERERKERELEVVGREVRSIYIYVCLLKVGRNGFGS